MKRLLELEHTESEAWRLVVALSREQRRALVARAIQLIQIECAELAAQVPPEIWGLVVTLVEQRRPDSVFRLACVSRDLHTAARAYVRERLAHRLGSENRVLRHFAAGGQLQSLKMESHAARYGVWVQLSRDLLATLTALTSLTLDKRAQMLDDDALHGLGQLRVLRLKGQTGLSNLCLRNKPHLHTLALRRSVPRISNMALVGLRALTSLDLSGNDKITDDGLRRLRLLQELHLDCNRSISDAGVWHLVHLHTLSLRGNDKITDQALSRLTGLTRLQLCQNTRITDAGLAALTRLHRLWLPRNSTITHLSLCELGGLRELHLYGNAQVRGWALARLTQLRYLALGQSTEALPDELGALTQLERLVTYDCDALSDASLASLTALRHLTNYGSALPRLITLERWIDSGRVQLLQLDHTRPVMKLNGSHWLRLDCK